jgi:glutamine---fructose-6-phosphate transaminase (isomerizing)
MIGVVILTLMIKEINEQPDILESCLQNNMNTIKEIVRQIRERNIGTVFIAARGTSDHAAVYGKYVIEILTGIPVALAAPSVFTMYNKSLNLKDTLVIGISQSGEAEDVREVVSSAAASGSITISITNNGNSPLACGAAYHLDCSAGPELSVAATKTFSAEMFLLAQLAACWSDNSNIRDELSTVPAKIRQTLKTSDGIKNKVQRYVFMNECFVLARGINYAVALECALKIQETTYIRAKAFASSDFYHGPLALIDRNIPVIVFIPEGPSFKDSLQMIKKLADNGIDIIAVSNCKDVLAASNCGFAIPRTENDIISPYPNVVISQLFACELALAKGLDPDKPRRLNKVTITR